MFIRLAADDGAGNLAKRLFGVLNDTSRCGKVQQIVDPPSITGRTPKLGHFWKVKWQVVRQYGVLQAGTTQRDVAVGLRQLLDVVIARPDGVDVGLHNAAFEQFAADKLEVLAGLRPKLLSDIEKMPGARILDGKFTAVQQAIGTSRRNAAAAAFLADFVEKAKASGLVARFIAEHKVRGLSVAPPA